MLRLVVDQHRRLKMREERTSRMGTNLMENRNAPMFRSRGVKGRGVGLARGRATVSRARASGRGGAPRG